MKMLTPVGKIDPLHDLGCRAHRVEVVGLGLVELVLDHHEADHAVGGQGLLHDLHVVGVPDHDRREDAGEYGASHEGDYRKLVRQYLLDGDYLGFRHGYVLSRGYGLKNKASSRRWQGFGLALGRSAAIWGRLP